VEFALTLPALMILVLGVYEMTRFILLNQKIDRVAYTVSDVVAQQTTVTTAEINDIMAAAAKIMNPYVFEENGLVIVSSVQQDEDDGPVVRWQIEGGGTLDRNSHVGVVNGAATLPDGLTLNDDDNVIIAEVFYDYIPTFTEDYFDTRENYKYAIFKPRFGALTTTPN
jgi:Flp pilus assembly protein TadG